MRLDRFTQKLQEAVQAAQALATDRQHTEFDNEHLLLVLLDQSEGLTRPLLEKLGVDLASLRQTLDASLAKRAQAHGLTAQTGCAAELMASLRAAEKEMTALKDEYVSVEHYLLALADSGVTCGKTLKATTAIAMGSRSAWFTGPLLPAVSAAGREQHPTALGHLPPLSLCG